MNNDLPLPASGRFNQQGQEAAAIIVHTAIPRGKAADSIKQAPPGYIDLALIQGAQVKVPSINSAINGDHYKRSDEVPDVYDFCESHNLSALQSSAIRYIYRFKNKNGVEDLCKVIHMAVRLAERHYKVDLIAEFNKRYKSIDK